MSRGAAARAEGSGRNSRSRHGQQGRGDREPRRPAYGRVVSRYLDQVSDLPRGHREESYGRERTPQGYSERQDYVMPSGQVRPLMGQNRI